MGGKVLVIGDDTRSFLAIVRSLGRKGVEVHAAPVSYTSPALTSRYIARLHYLPHWIGDGEEWLATVEALLIAERFDLVIPCNETALLPLQRHRERLSAFTRLAIPHDRAIEVLFDKHLTRDLAANLGVPIAPGRLPRPDDTAPGLFAEIGTPVVVKPRRSYALDTLAQRGKVQVVTSPAPLAALLPLDAEHVLLEGFVPGQGMGVSLLASEGRVLEAFEHHRVREDGSGSYYRVSAPLTPALLDACTRIVAALCYTGVAMFEFKSDRAGGRWVLLEVNARPWGSMPLPLSLGVDFPWRWYRLLTAGEVVPAPGYRPGFYGRNLVPDLRTTASEARAQAGRTGTLSVLPMLAGRVLEMGRVLTGRERHDVLVHDDPRPGLVELADIAGEAAGRLLRKLPGSRMLARAWARRQVEQALRGRGQRPTRIVFVCQGNICRSPFAAAVMRRHLTIPGLVAGKVEILSAGMMPRPGRPSPPPAIEVAASLGIELREHRSVHFSLEMAGQAALVLVFDRINRRALRDRYPALAAPVVMLGLLADEAGGRLGWAAEIDDPIDGDDAVYAHAYAAIEAGLRTLAAILQRTR